MMRLRRSDDARNLRRGMTQEHKNRDEDEGEKIGETKILD